MDNKLIMISDNDSVAVALCEIKALEVVTVNNREVTVLNDIPFGHKVALHDIKEDENIIKYGHAIGHARCDIKKGEHIHVHNLKTNLDGVLSYEYKEAEHIFEPFKGKSEYTFEGYVREDGKVGIRNEVWIIPTVGCVNTTAKLLEEQARKLYGDKVDDICAFT